MNDKKYKKEVLIKLNKKYGKDDYIKILLSDNEKLKNRVLYYQRKMNQINSISKSLSGLRHKTYILDKVKKIFILTKN